ncbi:MAG TPA: alginate lyase family protein [Steroidobacteraceae bacterium]|nr:alginate lyase family protein [Steroidobacteraceae bacterium]
MQQPGWYLQRLKGMSGAEVAHRLARKVRLLSQKFVSNELPPRDEAARDLRFLPPFLCVAPEHLTAAADRVLAGKFSFFDLTDCDLGSPPQWNRDPLTRRAAGARRASAIDYRDEREVGNIKYLWEPNRHLHLPLLAQAHALTGDQQYAVGIQAHIDSWIEQCPEGWGPNWVSPLELGIRLINWSITWQLLGGMRAKLFTSPDGAAFRERWLRSIYQHVRMIAGNLSRFSSANNHLVGEAAGVYVAASTWPLWPQMAEWGERCRLVLEDECHKQNAPDGGNREQAFAYQTFVLDFLLIAGLAARGRGEDFSPVYWRRIETMIDFLASMTSVTGNLPMIGDADDGYVVKLAAEPGFSPHISQIVTGAVLFGREDLASKAGALDGKTATLLGVEAVRRLAQLRIRGRHGFRPRMQFPESGYYLLGTAFETPDEVRLLVDSGSLGYLSIAAHGHADALSFVLSIGDREILVDPGTYAYHTEPSWRRYFRSTLAHNTVGIDGEDQSVQAGNFMWTHHAQARCIEFETGTERQRFVGEHYGYQRLTDPVAHRREIVHDARRQLIEVTDMLRCDREHRARRSWHFAEDCVVERAGSGLKITSGATQLIFEPRETLDSIEVHRGGGPEQGGWVSRSFGHKQPCTTVHWNSSISGVTVLRTRIAYTRARAFGI